VKEVIPIAFHWSDWLGLFAHYLSLSLLSIGGAITTAPEMHRYLVEQQRWLADSQFAASIAIAQASPGPNVLYIALIGWNVGMNTGSVLAGVLGALVTLFGVLLPSSTLTYLAGSWGYRNRELRVVRSFKQAMAPLVIGLLISTGWIMAGSHNDLAQDWPIWLVAVIAAILVWRTGVHLLLLLGAGALLGWFGLI
jgi:chromate transporter